MKSKFFFTLTALLMVLCSISFAQVPQMINYQGKLTKSTGAPVDTTISMVFTIYADSGGTISKWSETQTTVIVDKGVFNVLLGSVVPIPDSVFNGSVRYLGVKVGGDPEITPRKPMVSVAYAYRAGGGGGYWTFRITDTADTTLIAKGPWGIARYGNVLYGNRDSTHVNLGVACTTGTSGWNNQYCTVGGGIGNTASGRDATVGGGYGNTASNGYATVGGGVQNTASGSDATVGGGSSDTASGTRATVGGGFSNVASGSEATVGGGYSNTASGTDATVGGGYDNTASNWYATVGGGLSNVASGTTATVGGGNSDTASGTDATVGGGYSNTASLDYATVGGGYDNTASSWYATVGGGLFNVASGSEATVGGGYSNTASGSDATVGGGYSNTASALYATVPGGYADTAAGDYSFATGDRVRITSAGDYTFAFGSNFTTSASHAVIFYDSGTPIKVGIGTTSPQGALDVSSTTGALIVPRMTTAQRNALTAVNGMIIYNTTTNQFNFYEAGAWVTK
jgi:hypothetical protein